MADRSRTGDELRRRIVTFRDRGGGRFHRGEELHLLRLYRAAEVLGASRRRVRGAYSSRRLRRRAVAARSGRIPRAQTLKRVASINRACWGNQAMHPAGDLPQEVG
jgi:hypothetical protein